MRSTRSVLFFGVALLLTTAACRSGGGDSPAATQGTQQVGRTPEDSGPTPKEPGASDTAEAEPLGDPEGRSPAGPADALEDADATAARTEDGQDADASDAAPPLVQPPSSFQPCYCYPTGKDCSLIWPEFRKKVQENGLCHETLPKTDPCPPGEICTADARTLENVVRRRAKELVQPQHVPHA